MNPNSDVRVLLTWIWWLPLAMVFPVIGYLAGWLAGNSHTPMVSTLLPLVFGLVAALNLGVLEKRFRASQIDDKMKDLDEAVRTQVRDALELPHDLSMRAPATFAIALLLFGIACYAGVLRGIDSRISIPNSFPDSYPSLDELLELRETPPEVAQHTRAAQKSGSKPVDAARSGESIDAPQTMTEEPNANEPTAEEETAEEETSAVKSDEEVLREDFSTVIKTIEELFQERPELVRFVISDAMKTPQTPTAAALREAFHEHFAPPREELIARHYDLTPEEYALLHVLHLRLRSSRLPGENVKLVFRNSVLPIIQSAAPDRLERLKRVISTFFPSSSGAHSSSDDNGAEDPGPGLPLLDHDDLNA